MLKVKGMKGHQLRHKIHTLRQAVGSVRQWGGGAAVASHISAAYDEAKIFM